MKSFSFFSTSTLILLPVISQISSVSSLTLTPRTPSLLGNAIAARASSASAPTGTQFITGACASDADCASGCCGFHSGKCAGPVIAQERDGGCGFGDPQPNNRAAQAIQGPNAEAASGVNNNAGSTFGQSSNTNSNNNTKNSQGSATATSSASTGTQFITGSCSSDADCVSGCCGFHSGKCAGPVIAQERDGGCGFGDPQPNNRAAQAIQGPNAEAAPGVNNNAPSGSGNSNSNSNNNNNNNNNSGSTATSKASSGSSTATSAAAASTGTQFITGSCTSDADCASGCCGFHSGKCAGPVIAQERDGGCGFGDPSPNNRAAQAIQGPNAEAAPGVNNANSGSASGSGGQANGGNNGNSNNNNNGATGNANGNNDAQTSLTLDPRVIASGFAQDGQAQPTEGQVASLTSKNNFINFCLTVGNLPITNGKQIQSGSCNPAPIGAIPSVDNMPSSKFTSPANGDTVQPNKAFTISMAIKNIETGNFVNADTNYFAAPQQLNGQGQIIGHSHVVIEELQGGLGSTSLTDPRKFVFFKGINGKAQNGIVTADVTDGLPAGAYRMCSINAAANHQPVIVPIAQHGALDDCVYFTAGNDNGNANSNGGNRNNGNGTGAQGNNRRRVFAREH